MKDYYQILGVSSSAHAADIKRAYRKLAVTYHPDRNPDPAAEERFKEINEAYDVVGDANKRALYDQRLSNLWSEVVTPPPAAHRDPAYRRPRQAPRQPRPSETQELMRHYLPYVHWTCWATLVVVGLLLIDLILPYKITEERIASVYSVKSRKNGIAYFVAVTESGNKVKFYAESTNLYQGAQIRLAKTRIYSTNMWVESADGSGRGKLAYIYRTLLFIPATMLAVAAFGIFRKHNVDTAFSAGIVCGIFLVIFLVLL